MNTFNDIPDDAISHCMLGYLEERDWLRFRQIAKKQYWQVVKATKVQLKGRATEEAMQVISNKYNSYLFALDEQLFVLEFNYQDASRWPFLNWHTRCTLTQITGHTGNIQQVVTDGFNTLVVTDTGLFTCSYKAFGRLGRGDQQNRKALTQVTGFAGNIKQIVTDSSSTFVVTDRGLFACGNNKDGRLGISNRLVNLVWQDRPTLTQVTGYLGNIKQALFNRESMLIFSDMGLFSLYNMRARTPHEDSLEIFEIPVKKVVFERVKPLPPRFILWQAAARDSDLVACNRKTQQQLLGKGIALIITGSFLLPILPVGCFCIGRGIRLIKAAKRLSAAQQAKEGPCIAHEALRLGRV